MAIYLWLPIKQYQRFHLTFDIWHLYYATFVLYNAVGGVNRNTRRYAEIMHPTNPQGAIVKHIVVPHLQNELNVRCKVHELYNVNELFSGYGFVQKIKK